jgi:hypothetical protein
MMRRLIIAPAILILSVLSITACKRAPTVRVIARGAPIKSAFGINVDSRDRLYLASFREIVKGGRQLAPPAIVASGLKGPEGIAVEPDGSFLVVESQAGKLSRINPRNGSVNSVAEKLDLGSPAVFRIPFGIPDGVAVGPSGAIY